MDAKLFVRNIINKELKDELIADIALKPNILGANNPENTGPSFEKKSIVIVRYSREMSIYQRINDMFESSHYTIIYGSSEKDNLKLNGFIKYLTDRQKLAIAQHNENYFYILPSTSPGQLLLFEGIVSSHKEKHNESGLLNIPFYPVGFNFQDNLLGKLKAFVNDNVENELEFEPMSKAFRDLTRVIIRDTYPHRMVSFTIGEGENRHVIVKKIRK